MTEALRGLDEISTTRARTAYAPRTEVDLGTSQRLGGWVLTEQIGEGSLAQVFRARAASAPPDRPAGYAIKVLQRRWYDDPLVVELFRCEAQLGASVANPHLVSVLDANIQAAPYYLVMPYLEGATLAQLLRVHGRMSVPAAIWIARQVAEALSALHAVGFVHGDVKPANVFISSQGHATLLDLGFARRFEQTAAVAHRPVLGTCNYLAPEMLNPRLAIDQRSDLYSLGATLYEMICGEAPLMAANLEELAERHRGGDCANPRKNCPHAPRDLTETIRELLSKEPLRRPSSAVELRDRLIALELETMWQRIPA